MTTITAINPKMGLGSKINYATDVSKTDKSELAKLLSGKNWQEFDIDGDGKIDKSEIFNAKMTILAEKEEGNNNLFEGENEYSEVVSKNGTLITITKMPDGSTAKCKYDKDGNMIEELITDKHGQTTSFKYQYDKKTGMIID